MSIKKYPLVVDLDGTLIRTDMLQECILNVLRKRIYFLLVMPLWLLNGKAGLKKKLAYFADVEIKSLPFNQDLINWLRQQKDLGRKLVLCTATDLSIAKNIAAHLNLFEEVLGSNGKVNLAGQNKANLLELNYGFGGFDYIGNSFIDLAVWKISRRGVVVNGSERLIKFASRLTEIEHVIPKIKSSIKIWIKTLRLHQWLKNLLILVPILASHQVIDLYIGEKLAIAFLSFSLCASSMYVLNDLLDLNSDREHPRKCDRAFASGRISLWVGIMLSPLLCILSFLIANTLDGNFLLWLLTYFALTCLYSMWLKRLVLIDCVTLAILYTLRLIAGAAAVGVTLSFWLLALSIFLFLSLAYIKRYTELQIYVGESQNYFGRGYYKSDSPLLQQLGIASGFSATLILALYINSPNITSLYKSPEIFWGAIPLMLFWISWMWLKASRGLMHYDPVVFAIRDKVSVLTFVLFIAIFTLARIFSIQTT